MQGLTWAREGKHEESRLAYFKALVFSPNNAEKYLNLGDILRTQGKNREAMKNYLIALQLDRKYAARVYYNIGLVFAGQGMFDQAIIYYRQALAIKPDYDTVYINLGNALSMQNKYDDAILIYHKALDINQQSVEAHNNLGLILFHQNKLQEALQHFRAALAYKPNYESAKTNLQITLR